MKKYVEFEKFIDKLLSECTDKYGIELVFKSSALDRTGDIIKGNKYYAHANFAVNTNYVDKFVNCVNRLAETFNADIFIEKGKTIYDGGNVIVSVYYLIEEIKTFDTIKVNDLEEAEYFLKEIGIL